MRSARTYYKQLRGWWLHLWMGDTEGTALDEENYRQRVLALASLFLLITILSLLLVTPRMIELTDIGRTAAHLLFTITGATVIGAMLVQRYLNNRFLALHLLLLVYTATFALACMYFGGTRSPTFPLLITAPALAIIAGSSAAGIFWGTMVLFIWGALLFMERMGVEFQQIINPRNYETAMTLAYAALGCSTVSVLGAYAEMNRQLRGWLLHSNQELDFLSSHDSLTGLHNRRHYDETLDSALQQARGTNHHVGLILLDLDDFKVINDTHGHSVGDTMLVRLAQRLSANVRETDLVARLGGDEFAVVLDKVHSLEEVHTIAEKLAEVISEPLRVGEHALAMQASVGIALYPLHANSRSRLEAKADHAMYSAKQGEGSVAAAL